MGDLLCPVVAIAPPWKADIWQKVWCLSFVSSGVLHLWTCTLALRFSSACCYPLQATNHYAQDPTTGAATGTQRGLRRQWWNCTY